MFSQLQKSIVSYLKQKELIHAQGIHVWTNSDGDLDAMIQSDLNALHPLALIVLDIAPDTVGGAYQWLTMPDVGIDIRLIEDVTLNSTPVHAIDLTFPLLQWLHSWAPQDIDGFTGVLMARQDQPVLDEQTTPGKVQKLYRFTTAAEAETDHSTRYNA